MYCVSERGIRHDEFKATRHSQLSRKSTLGSDKHLPDPRYVGYVQFRIQWARWHTCNRLARFLFLGVLAKLRKASISFFMFIRLSARMEQLGSNWTGFREVSYIIIWRKSVEKVQLSLKSDKYNRYFR